MSVNFTVSVSLPVYKELTRRLEEGLTHDDVIRDLLALDSPVEPENEMAVLTSLLTVGTLKNFGALNREGFHSRGLWLPNGTILKARYKGSEYAGRIHANRWLDDDDKQHTSPSAAAYAITNTNVNGLRFWEGRRPEDVVWRRLDVLARL
jgi:hypothetical protein